MKIVKLVSVEKIRIFHCTVQEADVYAMTCELILYILQLTKQIRRYWDATKLAVDSSIDYNRK